MSEANPQSKQEPPRNPPRPPSGAQGQHSGAIWFWIAGGVILIIAVILFFHHKGQSSASAHSGHGGRGGSGPVVVGTITAQQGDIGVYVSALGTVTPLNMVSVNSRVEGQIVKINYQEGQYVHAGDPLLVIDPGPNQASLTQSEGQLERDTALLEDAKLDLQRYQEAYASNAIPKQQLDTQVATVHQDEGTVKLDQGELDNAKVQLAYCYITAPISGRIGLRLVDEGNIVQAGSTNLVIITQLQPISVIFYISEDYLPEIMPQVNLHRTNGTPMFVDIYDHANQIKLATGTLETLDNQVNPNTGTIQFRAILTNEDESLFPNQFVNAHLLVKTLHNVTLLPNTAIQRNSDTAYVYTVQPAEANPTNPPPPAVSPGSTNSAAGGSLPSATVSLQNITVGTTDGNVSQVTGIDPGTVIVADNFNKLTDGAKVFLRPSTDSTNQTSQVRTHKKKKKDSQ